MVSRFELYVTMAPIYLFPAVLFIASGGPENPLRFFLSLSICVGMMGVSLMYSVMAMRETSRGPGPERKETRERERGEEERE